MACAQICVSFSYQLHRVDFCICARWTVILLATLKEIFVTKFQVDLIIHYQVMMCLIKYFTSHCDLGYWRFDLELSRTNRVDFLCTECVHQVVRKHTTLQIFHCLMQSFQVFATINFIILFFVEVCAVCWTFVFCVSLIHAFGVVTTDKLWMCSRQIGKTAIRSGAI